jgi:hypothetical protein
VHTRVHACHRYLEADVLQAAGCSTSAVPPLYAYDVFPNCLVRLVFPAGALPFPARLFSSSTGSGNRLAGVGSIELPDLEAAAAAGAVKHK